MRQAIIQWKRVIW